MVQFQTLHNSLTVVGTNSEGSLIVVGTIKGSELLSTSSHKDKQVYLFAKNGLIQKVRVSITEPHIYSNHDQCKALSDIAGAWIIHLNLQVTSSK